MIYKIEFFELKYPRDYRPGDGYKKTLIGRSWLSEYTVRKCGWETALWHRAAHLRITGRVTDFRVYEFTDTQPCFLGSM